MELPIELVNLGFSLADVTVEDLVAYLDVKRACYRGYVDQYFGGWDENVQMQMNTDAFGKMCTKTCFQKISLNGLPVGFGAYDVQEEKIDGLSIQMISAAQNKGMGSFFLRRIIALSDQTGKPAYLKVFKSNPAQNLYKRFGFKTYDESDSHFYMRYDPAPTVKDGL